jgi:uncharacterized membrane protein YkgB
MAHSTTMTYLAAKSVAGTELIGSKITFIGHQVIRYGLALVIGWIGLMKFTGYEASGIQPLVAHSPLLSWMYRISTVRQFSDGLGVVEVAIAVLIALRPWSRKACVIGSALAVPMFLKLPFRSCSQRQGGNRVSVAFQHFPQCPDSSC